MAETRRCKVRDGNQTKDGKFFQFGNTIFYDEGNNPHTKVVAIVELDGGQVVEADPHTVKFTD